ncbi:MAG: hypothetical protein J5496_01590 [Lachnospiraceae bacterium]|nr:hypothetical protein [Lachnospiraceae bacterium]
MIPVYIVAGLLDSGKTTFIENTLMEQEWMGKGTTLLILCEEGEHELTEAYRQRKKLVSIPIGSPDVFTKDYCEEITAAMRPAQIIIEFNGMWNLKDFLQKDFPKNWGLAGIYSVVNGEDLELVMNNMRNLFMSQHTESDLIVINRCRKDLNRQQFRKAIKLQNPVAQLIFESVTGEIIEFGEEDLPYDIKAPAFTVDEIDYGTFFSDASENPERYLKKRITFLCQLFRPIGMPKNMFVPGRKIMACCAADIQFYGFPCKSDRPLRFANNSWHTITVEFGTEKRKDPRSGNPVQVPVLRLIDLKDAEAPAEEVVTL